MPAMPDVQTIPRLSSVFARLQAIHSANESRKNEYLEQIEKLKNELARIEGREKFVQQSLNEASLELEKSVS